MVFSDPIFIFIYLPLVYCLFHWGTLYIPNEACPKVILIAASLIFYGMWDYRYLVVLCTLLAIGWYAGKIASNSRSRLITAVCIVCSLTPLLFFKYAGWLSGHNDLMQLALPLGISFISFQIVAYIVDSYSQKITSPSGTNYLLFILFFPQLIAGPIVHYREISPQFDKLRQARTSKQTEFGMVLITFGLLKKVAIADQLAGWVQIGFDSDRIVSLYEAWVGLLSYTLQIYFDFSAYCEIAMGIGLLFGITLPVNFRSPYKSRSVREFWRTWHITLGLFFKRYVYIAMGGSRSGLPQTICLLIFVSFLSGMWHGAGSQFIVWGLLHGIALAINHLWSSFRSPLPENIATAITLLFVAITWVFFRADSLEHAQNILASLVGLNGVILPPLLANVISLNVVTLNNATGFEIPVLLFGFWFCLTQPNIHELSIQPTSLMTTKLVASSIVTLFFITGTSTFLYFQF